MSSDALLVPDLLREIILRLPLALDQKFAVAQVSRFWRDIALGSPLFWSSFSGAASYPSISKLDCLRIPLVLERSGLSAPLQIHLVLPPNAGEWPGEILTALVPYASRIETLDVEFGLRLEFDASALLASNLSFPALRTLRLIGPEYALKPNLSLKAPRLRTLDIERICTINVDALLLPDLEVIRLSHVWTRLSIEILSHIFVQCPKARRVVLHGVESSPQNTDNNFQVFIYRPLAPALRELELGMETEDFVGVLKAGFSDRVLHKITVCTYNNEIDTLAPVLLSGCSPLVLFDFLDYTKIEVCDDHGRTRSMEYSNEDGWFGVQNVWEYFSVHYDLHKTVREMRIRFAYWEDYAEVFESYAPQLQDGITLAVEVVWVDESEDFSAPSSKIIIPGLSKVEFCTPAHTWEEMNIVLVERIGEVLALIELPTVRTAKVCVGNVKKLRTRKPEQDPVLAFHQLLSGTCWNICSHCDN
ncbi:hypothetical protein C8F04DRAFT_1077751 [Mycena alexandri]|uniref:F-box domain-containing protein n=1 Tax=Mycena alexandri TaxID=1745969 RepID=A0AAD6TDF7_9AGAR|nr:hypothetical protein C8F04DRAFT_1077751 [Mycena alexandri]